MTQDSTRKRVNSLSGIELTQLTSNPKSKIQNPKSNSRDSLVSIVTFYCYPYLDVPLTS
jgi:hypothetical protein